MTDGPTTGKGRNVATEEKMSAAPVRLYVDHMPGHYPDAILLSEATIAFVKGVKELAIILDPSGEIEVGLFPSEPGSFWQNTILRARAEYERRARLYQLAAAAMIWFVQPPLERVRANLWAPILDQYAPELTPAERNRAVEQIERVVSGNVAEKERQLAYQAFSRDPAVTAVGVNVEQTRPRLIVPRSQFFSYSGAIDADVFGLDRSTTTFERVVLISPVLEIGTRRWKLRTAKGEIGATIKDGTFLEHAVLGQLAVPLRGGIQMDVKLETKEKLVDGLWKPVEYNVIEVLGVQSPPTQQRLFP